MAESDEFRNVVWDMPNDNNRPSGDQPAVMDPLSDIHEALNEPLSAVAYESPVTSEEGQPAQVNVEMSDDPVVVPTAAMQHYNNESASSSKSTEIPEWRTIHVTDPRKETSKDGHQSTFISYRIVSHVRPSSALRYAIDLTQKFSRDRLYVDVSKILYGCTMCFTWNFPHVLCLRFLTNIAWVTVCL